MSARKKGPLFDALIVFLIFLLISTPNVFAASDPMDESRIDNIVCETVALPEYLDPHKDYESAGSHVSFNVYETLFTYPWDTAETNISESLLAESVDISADGLDYTFTLRQGVTFHDGSPFNATCVKMNIWRMLGRGWDDGFGPVWMIAEPILGGQAVEDAVFEYGDGSPEHIAAWEHWIENVPAVEVLGDHEVAIHLAYPFTPFIPAMTYSVGSMISPNFFMEHGGMSPESDDFYLDDHMCGTGPYIFHEWYDNDNLTIVRNENYWRAADAKLTHPYAGTITKVTWKKNTDINSRMLNLQAGTIDTADWGATKTYDIWNNVTERDPTGFGQSLNPGIKVWTGLPNYNVMFLGFKLNEYLNHTYYDLGLSYSEIVKNPFRDWEVRAAISHAFDYQALIDNAMNGIGIQLGGPIPHGMFAHDEDLVLPELDLETAVAHWNLAMTNGLDDILANNSYELHISYNEGNTVREAASLLIKQAFENIIADPISVNPSSPLSINVAAIPAVIYPLPGYTDHDPFLFFLGWMPDYTDPHNYIEPFVKSTGTYPCKMGLEDSFGEDGAVWDRETVDGWIDAAAAESDPEIRTALYAQIQDAIVDHCAYLWCHQGVEFHVERCEMNGYSFNPMHDSYFYYYYKLRVEEPADLFPSILPVVLATSAIVIGVIAIVILKKSSSD